VNVTRVRCDRGRNDLVAQVDNRRGVALPFPLRGGRLNPAAEAREELLDIRHTRIEAVHRGRQLRRARQARLGDATRREAHVLVRFGHQ
jgi:hypothetical protein